MFEDLITQLDDLGVTYTEDYEGGVLDINIADIDKDTLISVISAVNDSGYTFSITETNISVESGEIAEPTGEEELPEEGMGEEDYMGSALEQYNG